MENTETISRITNSRSAPFSMLVATGLGVGLLPLAPGTWGSILAAVGIWFLYLLPDPLAFHLNLVLLLLFFPLSWYTAGKAAVVNSVKDPSFVVIDEVYGMLVCAAIAPMNFYYLIAGFALFRLFDITKPVPVRNFEKLPGGLGIVADDIMAGVYAGLCLLAFHYIYNAF
jgi:phosphatidylglycerophosphatase A